MQCAAVVLVEVLDFPGKDSKLLQSTPHYDATGWHVYAYPKQRGLVQAQFTLECMYSLSLDESCGRFHFQLRKRPSGGGQAFTMLVDRTAGHLLICKARGSARLRTHTASGILESGPRGSSKDQQVGYS